VIVETKFRKGHQRAGFAFASRNERRFKGSTGTNTVQTQSGPPAQVLQNYENVYNQAQNVAAQPLQTYQGATVAGFTPMQEAGFNNVNTAVNAATPYLNDASQYMTNAGTSIDPTNFGTTEAAYQSPYTSQVVNATEAEQANQNAQQQQQVEGNAVSSGAWGGDRSGVAAGITAGQQALAEEPVIANLENTGFQNATNAAESNAYLNSQTGYGLSSLGSEAEGLGLTGANAQITAGGAQQQQEQNELNVPYQAFQAAQAYPYQTTNWLEGMATGTGTPSGTTGSTTSPGPSTLSQVAGLGLTGLAGYNLANNAGLFSGSGVGPSGTSIANAYYNSAANSGEDLSGFYSDATGGKFGGRIERAPGGAVPGFMPMADGGATINVGTSNGLLGGSNNLLGGGGNLLGVSGSLLGGGGNLMTTPTGSTSTTTGAPMVIGPEGQAINAAGQAVASYYGTPIAGLAAGAFSREFPELSPGAMFQSDPAGMVLGGFARGGHVTLEDFAHHVAGLRPVPVRPRGFDAGGDVSPALTASVGGNPTLAQAAQTYQGLPTDQLRQMAQRFAPSTPQGQLVARALQQRQMYPQTNPAQPAVPGLAPLGATTPQTGTAPPGPFAKGGDVEDDLSDLPVAQPGPSVPGGLMAGLSSMQADPAAMLAQHAMAMNRSGGYVPPPPDLAPVVMDAAQRSSVDPKALAWMLSQESHWNPAAYNPSSGTAGLGQFKAATAKEEGIDPRDPIQSIYGAADYLRKKLDQTGGDYEAAIGRYGTFSTGRGSQADNAVRGQYRAFMQGSKFGGAVRLADGGDPGDDSNYVDPSGLLQPGGHASDTPWLTGGMATPVSQPQNAGLAPLPNPPLQAVAPPPTAGLTALPGDAQEARSTIKADPWQSVLTAGLSMMAGTSPHPLTNIGAGGAAGVKDYEQQRQLAIQDQQRADLAKTNQAYRAAQSALLGARTTAVPVTTGIAQQNADTRAAAVEAANKRADTYKLVGDARSAYIKGQLDMLPAVTDAKTTAANAAADRAAAAGTVAAARAPLLNAQTAAVPVTTDARTAGSAAATSRAATAASSAAANLELNRSKAVGDLIARTSDPFTHVPTMSPDQARQKLGFPPAAAQAPAPSQTPMVPAAPAAPAAPPLPPGLPSGARKAPDGNYYVPNPNGGWLRAVPSGG
jgi:hypothetical protein